MRLPAVRRGLSALSLLLVACGSVWPSRGMTVDLERANASANEIEAYVATVLVPHGFTDAGKTGRDQLRNVRTLFFLKGPGRLQVVVDVSRRTTVPIRVNENRSTFSKEANDLYQSLASELEQHWPGAVTREAHPTK